MDYKNSLLMPVTSFKMKANLTQKEMRFRKEWLQKKIYEQVLEQNKNNKSFLLHDGPIYANGDLHVGHALNRILKDIIIRRKNMEGLMAPFVAGWDTHGLPIELKMLEHKQKKRDEMDKLTLRKEATKFAFQQIAKQKNQFSQMQLFSPLNETYLTFDKSYEVAQLELFKKMVFDGLIYKGLKPIYWSPSSQSALAEAEVEYKPHRAPQIIVALEINNENKYLKKGDFLLIMTTTPWTLVANAAVAINKDFEYDIVLVNNKKYVIASDLVSKIALDAKWKKYLVIATIKGSDLVGIQYTCPLKKNLKAPVVSASFVSLDTGTGLVHLAPLFGEDDYLVGKKENLNMIMHVDDKGYFTDQAGKYATMFHEVANKEIGLDLEQDKKLISLKFIKHSYPHDWRTGKPIIYRGVPQWFVNIKPIKNQILASLEEVRSFPDWGLKRLRSMIKNRNEWTISRQRTWGVPIIIFYDKNKKPVLEKELFDHVINLVAQHGTDVWWEKTTEELLPKKYQNRNYSREMDIMDVWFDSGASSIAIKINNQSGPFDLYIEGNDQYRGWFNTSLINSVAFHKVAPFKTFISHGFVLDAKQEKMSKSKGNIIDPIAIINNHGAEILRLWAANSEYFADVRISDEIIKQSIELYRKLRNFIRFMIGNLNDYDYQKNQIKLTGIHSYIGDKVNEYNYQITKSYQNYEFIDVVKNTSKFLANLSSWYFNYAKDILYCNAQNDRERRMIQTNLFTITKSTLLALAPILPTTTEEAYQLIPNYAHNDSVFLEQVKLTKRSPNFEQDWVIFETKIRPLVNNLIEKQIQTGIVKRSNELILYIKSNSLPPTIQDLEKIAKYLLVAKVQISEHKTYVEKFDSVKCLRCWNHFYEIEINNKICQRCKIVTRDS